MQITKAAIQDIPQIKQLWNICFDKESKDYTDFLSLFYPRMIFML